MNKNHSTSLVDRLLDRRGDSTLTVAHLSQADAEALAARLGEAKILCRFVDGAGLKNKADLFAAIAQTLDFPSYFGGNWDALVDCLSDMSWIPAKGYVLVLLNAGQFCEADEEAHDTLAEICLDAAERYKDDDEPAVFFKFVQATSSADSSEQ